tara:strand:- start:42128 stop:42256 length:129 start_codon:yes stop_codon:yes gene_type:complete
MIPGFGQSLVVIENFIIFIGTFHFRGLAENARFQQLAKSKKS